MPRTVTIKGTVYQVISERRVTHTAVLVVLLDDQGTEYLAKRRPGQELHARSRVTLRNGS